MAKTKKTPPKNRKQKLPAAYAAMIGQMRECDTCHETKEISFSTFVPLNAGPNGVHTTCRRCQYFARTYEPALEGRQRYHAAHNAGHRSKMFPVRLRDHEEYWAEVDRLSEALLKASQSKRPNQADVARLKKLLTAATRLKTDPAGGGAHTDPTLAFKTFMRCMRPALADYTALGPIHDDIIEALLCPDPNVVLLASRGSAKSTITAMFCTWLLWRDPERETILVVSRSEVHAKKMLRAIRAFVEVVPLLEELRPDEEQIDSAFQMDVRPAKGKLGMSTSITCRGLAGQITGLRARTIIGDDIEGPRDDSPEAVDRLEEAIAEFQHVAIPGAKVTLLGTPQSPFSLYGRLGRSDAWTVFTACVFTSDIIDGEEVFESRWPARFSPEEILKRKKAVSKRNFALHYRLDLTDTIDREQPFKLSALPVLDWPTEARLIPFEIKGGNGEIIRGLPRGRAEEGDEWRAVTYVSPDSGAYTQVVAAVDPASGLRGGKYDAIGLAIVGVTQGGRGVIRVAQGVRGDSTQAAIRETARLIVAHGANTLLVEETAGSLFGQMLCAHLASVGYPMRYEPVKTGGMRKGRRIVEAISPALASGKLSICLDVLKHEDAAEFVEQYSGMDYDGRKLRHDDIIDAVSYAVQAVAPALATDEEEMAAAARYTVEELVRMPKRRCVLTEEELEAFVLETEEEVAYQGKLDRALDEQREQQARGREAPALDKYIDQLRSILDKLRKARRRIVMPNEARQISDKSREALLRRKRIGLDADTNR